MLACSIIVTTLFVKWQTWERSIFEVLCRSYVRLKCSCSLGASNSCAGEAFKGTRVGAAMPENEVDREKIAENAVELELESTSRDVKREAAV